MRKFCSTTSTTTTALWLISVKFNARIHCEEIESASAFRLYPKRKRRIYPRGGPPSAHLKCRNLRPLRSLQLRSQIQVANQPVQIVRMEPQRSRRLGVAAFGFLQ